MPEQIKVYRAHRPGETDWVAYTFDPQAAAKFALQREVSEIVEYLVPKTEILALFLRRGEKEILVLDRSKVQQLRVLQVRTR